MDIHTARVRAYVCVCDEIIFNINKTFSFQMAFLSFSLLSFQFFIIEFLNFGLCATGDCCLFFFSHTLFHFIKWTLSATVTAIPFVIFTKFYYKQQSFTLLTCLFRRNFELWTWPIFFWLLMSACIISGVVVTRMSPPSCCCCCCEIVKNDPLVFLTAKFYSWAVDANPTLFKFLFKWPTKL